MREVVEEDKVVQGFQVQQEGLINLWKKKKMMMREMVQEE
jgi:hypothetical protein